MIYFGLGLFLGAILGFLLACWLAMAKYSDLMREVAELELEARLLQLDLSNKRISAKKSDASKVENNEGKNEAKM